MVAPLFRRKGFPAHKFPVQLGDTVAPFVPVDFPPPAVARQRGTIDLAVNLLLTTLAVVTAVQNVVIREPFYSVAGRAKSAPEWQVPPNLLTNTLVPVVAGTPFEPIDLPLNRRTVNVPQFDPVRNISVLQLQAAPFKPVDLPIERAVSIALPFDPPNVLINIPATAALSFTGPYVTPIQGAVRQVLSFEPPNVTINLPTTAAVPFRPYDWTGPGRAESAIDWNVGQNIALTNAKPFTPVDFGLTKARQQVGQFEQPNPALVLALQAAPFVPTDWGLSKAKQQVGPFEPPNLLLSTLALPPPAPPFVGFDWAPAPHGTWSLVQDPIPNLLTSTFNPTSPPIPPPVSTETFSGGWPIYAGKVRAPKEIKRRRIELGILPPEEEIRAEEALEQVVLATVELAQAQPETKAATDALQSQRRAQDLFLAAYLRVYPALEEQRILEALRLEAHRLVLIQEEEFAIVLSLL